MSQRDDYEPGVPCWVDTLQPDPDVATAFYAGLFGWDFAGPGDMPGDPPGRYFVARVRDRADRPGAVRLDHRDVRSGRGRGHDVPAAGLRGRRAPAACVARGHRDDVGLTGDAPPHWSANFWDHDVDATASKAVKLGGGAVVAPFDTPVSRMAVLADPQGVTFSISNVPGR